MSTELEQYKRIKIDIVNVSKAYQDGTKVEKFSSHIEHKLNHFKPTIMLYGVYNAGKSTLLNAIFGKDEMAITGDAPETAEVRPYNYNGYTIYDTPGINAPIEHQKVTDEHLSKSELIIFVLSNHGSFEERYIYEKIGDLIKAKKPVLIALNNKSGIDMSSIEAQQEIAKVNQHLSTVCDSMGIEKAEEKVSIAFVDAKTALEGKLEKEQELIDESNIEYFEKTMDALLGKSGKEEVSNALNLYIAEYINDTLSVIDSRIDNPEIRKTQELITYLEKFKQRTLVNLKNIAMQTVALATARFLELLLAKDQKSIEEMLKVLIDDMYQKIRQEMKQVQTELEARVDKYRIEFEELLLDAPNINIDLEKMPKAQHIGTEGGNGAVVASAGTIIASAIPPTLIVPTPLGPIPVKPLVMLASVLFGAFSGSSEARIHAEAKLEAKRAQHLSAKNQSDVFGMDFKVQLLQNIHDNLDANFDPLIQNFIGFSNKICNENDLLIKDKEKLQTLLSEL